MTLPVLGNLKRGLLFILSAPAGTGKTTLMQMLTHEFPCVVASVSFTTRAPREGEVNGVHYHFIAEEEFEAKIAAGDFLEHVKLYGDHYGTSKVWVEKQLNSGKHVVLVIDIQGARKLKETLHAVSIFVAPPSMEELEKRLRLRKTESSDVIDHRLEWAKKEMLAKDEYDYCIVNDDLASAYDVFRSILIAEEHKIR